MFTGNIASDDQFLSFKKNLIIPQPFKNKTIRNIEQTKELYSILIDIFPNSCENINKLLNQNPCELDINFFTFKLLDTMN